MSSGVCNGVDEKKNWNVCWSNHCCDSRQNHPDYLLFVLFTKKKAERKKPKQACGKTPIKKSNKQKICASPALKKKPSPIFCNWFSSSLRPFSPPWFASALDHIHFRSARTVPFLVFKISLVHEFERGFPLFVRLSLSPSLSSHRFFVFFFSSFFFTMRAAEISLSDAAAYVFENRSCLFFFVGESW